MSRALHPPAREQLPVHKISELCALILKCGHSAPTRALVNPLLDLLAGGKFDLKQNFIIKDPNWILLILKLLPDLPDNLQLELWNILSVVLQRSLLNIHKCRQLKLIDNCLEHLTKTKSERVAGYIALVIEILAGYNLTIQELKAILFYLYKSEHSTDWAPHAILLVKVLSNLPGFVQPDVFFNFSGAPGAAITLPPLAKWPSQAGFTFSTWIRIEKTIEFQREYYKPVVYWFRTGKGMGYSAHLVGSTLVLETAGKGTKKTHTCAVEFAFQSHHWYMLTVAYVHNRLKNSEVMCYVDGILSSTGEVALPATDDVYDKCFLGTSPTGSQDTTFQGQMTAVYVFKEALGSDVVKALHKLGSSYKSRFRFEAECDVALTSAEKKLLFDGSLADSVLFSYNAKAMEGQLLYETSPLENATFFVHSPHASVLQGVEPVVTTPFQSVLHSLGGIQALFPLIAQLDLAQSLSHTVDYTLSAKLLSLLLNIARSSNSYLQHLVQMNALNLINHLLKKVSPSHLCSELVGCLFNFMSYLSDAPNGAQLLQQMIEQLLFDGSLWVGANAHVQTLLYGQLSTQFCRGSLGMTGLNLRDLVGVGHMLFILKENYSLTTADEEQAERLAAVRPFLLQIIKKFVTQGKGMRPQEMDSIVSYLSVVQEEKNMRDVLGFLLELLFESSDTVTKMFEHADGLKAAVKLIACFSEELTLNAIKLIGKVLHHSSQKHRLHLIQTMGLFAVVKEKLLSAGQPFSVPMFNTLYEILVNCPSKTIVAPHFIALDLAHDITFPDILAVMVELVTNLPVATQKTADADIWMRMQLLSYVTSLCTQNDSNCKALLQLREWQHWFLVLADHPLASETDYQSLQDMLFRLFHVVLMYSFQEEQEGFAVWVKTCAALHAYSVSKMAASGVTELESQEWSFTMPPLSEGDLSTTDQLCDLETSQNTISEEDERQPEGRDGDASELTSQDTEHATFVFSDGDGSSADDLTADSKVQRSTSGRGSGAQSDPTAGDGDEGGMQGGGASEGVGGVEGVSSSSTQGSLKPWKLHSIQQLMSAGSIAAAKKMPRFKWSRFNLRLLEDLLQSLQMCVAKWNNGTMTRKASVTLAEYVNDPHRTVKANITNFLALIVDNMIALNGGLKHLLTQSILHRGGDPKQLPATIEDSCSASLHRSIEGDPAKVQSLLQSCVELEDAVILGGGGGGVKASLVEARMRMEAGGMARQGLRLVLSVASLTCIKAIAEHKELQENYHREKRSIAELGREVSTLLTNLGIAESSLEKHLQDCLGKRTESLKDVQCMLSDSCVAYFRSVVPRDGDSKQTLQQVVVIVIYYLSVLCVSKYQHILDIVTREKKHKDRKSGVKSFTPQMPPRSGSMAKEEVPRPSDSGEVPRPAEEWEKSLGFLPDFRESAQPSLTIMLSSAVDISDHVKVSLKLVGQLLCDLLVEYKSLLGKVLVCEDGEVLLTDEVMALAQNHSIVEVTMMLCSQNWQTSLKKIGGKAFVELLSEGGHVAQFCDLYFRSMAAKIQNNVKKNADTLAEKFMNFEEELSIYLGERIKSELEDSRQRKAESRRFTSSATELWRKVSYLMDHSSSSDLTPLKMTVFRKLDFGEDMARRRLKVLPNPGGSSHLEACRKQSRDEMGEKEEEPALPGVLVVGTSLQQGEDPGLNEDAMEGALAAEFGLDHEEAQLSMKCSIVMYAYAMPGYMEFTKSTLTFTADDTSSEYQKGSYLLEFATINGKWILDNVRAVFTRFYLHQRKALEIFFSDRSSVFFVFDGYKDVKQAIRRLPKVGVGNTYGLPQTRTVSLWTPQQLFKKSPMATRWEKREISNFDYLMFLNTIAGRTYNDLTQYPVFPWILADYSSDKLDLNDPNTFRDLTKPIGALNPVLLAQREEKFETWIDDQVPPFLYGTHYSTMAFVLHWLARVEPFSTLHIDFHDGYFDHSARMFSSVHNSWRNSLQDSSDVKELIPEFFYFPEMFLNENKLSLGKCGVQEEGDTMCSVILPPWASSAEDFVYKHRQALESDYVSANLHHWIDLIFGFQQRGEEAIKAKNVFYYLTYIGAVRLEGIEDQQLRRGLEEQIRQFGQTPTQLLLEPHPSRSTRVKELPHQPLKPQDASLVASLPLVPPDAPVVLVQLTESPHGSSVLAVSCTQLYSLNRWNIIPATVVNQPNMVSLEADPQLAKGSRPKLGVSLDQSVVPTNTVFAATPNNEFVFICGFWDRSFKCFETESGSMVHSVFGHRGIVSCIAYCPEKGLCGSEGCGFIASGSHDATVLLWRWSGKQDGVLNPTSKDLAPVALLTGHEQAVITVSISATVGAVVSATKTGCCLVHSMTGELLHKLLPPSEWTHPHLTTFTNNGHILVHYSDQKGALDMFSCNGRHLCELALQDNVLALAVSEDGCYVVCGGIDCKVWVFETHNLELKFVYETCGSTIRSLHISKDQKFIFTGLASGSIIVYSTHLWYNS